MTVYLACAVIGVLSHAAVQAAADAIARRQFRLHAEAPSSDAIDRALKGRGVR